MTAIRLHRYPSPSGGIALGKMGVGATMLKQGKTARDYVQSGLVAMWDGIENAGWGLHDDEATAVKNLVTNVSNSFPVSSIGSVSVTSDALRFTCANGGAFTFNVTSPDISAKITIESVWRIVAMPTAPSGNCFPVQFLGGNARIPIIGNTGAQSLYWGGVGQPRLNMSAIGGTQKISGAWVADSSGGTVAYNNGASLRAYTSYSAPTRANNTFFYSPTSVGWPAGTIIDLYCVRQYSRALTADEIAHNYAIDKERFNLP